jgi:hypothetical protein
VEPFTYVVIILLASWTCALVMATRWTQRFWNLGKRYEIACKNMSNAQMEVNKAAAEHSHSAEQWMAAEKSSYAATEKLRLLYEKHTAEFAVERASYEATLLELKERLQAQADGDKLSPLAAVALAGMIAGADTDDGGGTLSLLLIALLDRWSEHAWVSLVSDESKNPNRWTIDKVHLRASNYRD